MILVHKLKGEPLWVNPDLVSFVESNHDTVLTLHDGRHLVVAETPEEVADALQQYRASTLALAFRIHSDGASATLLLLVPEPEPEPEGV